LANQSLYRACKKRHGTGNEGIKARQKRDADKKQLKKKKKKKTTIFERAKLIIKEKQKLAHAHRRKKKKRMCNILTQMYEQKREKNRKSSVG
jgi:hypothetical protein